MTYAFRSKWLLKPIPHASRRSRRGKEQGHQCHDDTFDTPAWGARVFGLRAALARLGVKAGIEKRVHPHGLRHSLAFDMAMTGEPTHQIQAALGHSSLAITDRYVRYIAPADVVATMRSREW